MGGKRKLFSSANPSSFFHELHQRQANKLLQQVLPARNSAHSDHLQPWALYLVSSQNGLVAFELEMSPLSAKRIMKDSQRNAFGSLVSKSSLHRHLYLLDSDENVRAIVRTSDFNVVHVNVDVKCWILPTPLPVKSVQKKDLIHRPADVVIAGKWQVKDLTYTGSAGQILARIIGDSSGASTCNVTKR